MHEAFFDELPDGICLTAAGGIIYLNAAAERFLDTTVPRAKNVAIVLTVPDEIVTEADRELLSRVVQNVLDNAVKYTSIRLPLAVPGRDPSAKGAA